MPKGHAKSDRPAPAEEQREKLAAPPHYQVLMHNDDYTTMEFVVEMLERVFHKTTAEANHVMLQVHLRGSGVCGVYPAEIAETKVTAVHRLARAAGYPLRCSLQVT